MIDRKHKLPVSHQCALLGLARSSAYYTPREVSPEDLALMRRIDAWHLEHPFAGARRLRDLLRPEGFQAGRRHIGTLMARMGIEALYRKPHTSRRQRGDEIYSYLLRDLAIERPNQVWAADITYIPMRRGFLYLFAVIDGYSRRVLAWRLSNTLTTDFCREAVREALHRYGCPEIFNTDQGGQFTSDEFTGLIKAHGIRISRDGKGSWRENKRSAVSRADRREGEARHNVFVERLWKTVKYEEGYLKADDRVADAKAHLATYLRFYNERRPHRSLDGFPDIVHAGAAGDHYDDDLRVHGFDRLQGFEATDLGHHDIQADDVRPQAFCKFKCVDTIPRFANHIVLFAAQDSAQQCPHQIVVINDEDSWRQSAHPSDLRKPAGSCC